MSDPVDAPRIHRHSKHAMPELPDPARSLAGRVIVASLPEHKFLLADLPDAVVTPPLGHGGLEERGEVLTRPRSGRQRKPCGIKDGKHSHPRNLSSGLSLPWNAPPPAPTGANVRSSTVRRPPRTPAPGQLRVRTSPAPPVSCDWTTSPAPRSARRPPC